MMLKNTSVRILCLALLAAGAGVYASPMDGGSPQTAGQHGTDDSSSAQLWKTAQKMFATNDFAQASSAASRVTSPALRKDAQAMVAQIHSYVAALQDGVAAEARHDSAAAIQAYSIAAAIKSDGPGNPAGRIARVQQMAAVNAPAPDAALKAKQAQHSQFLAQQHAKAGQMVARATAEEAAGHLVEALGSYRQAQESDPTNATASQGVARLTKETGAGEGGPVAPLSAEAIRSFYAGQFAQAEQQLDAILARGAVPDKPALYFYLGAARFYRNLLEAHRPAAEAAQQPEVETAFRQAHHLGYVPLPQFVAPVLLQAWNGVS